MSKNIFFFKIPLKLVNLATVHGLAFHQEKTGQHKGTKDKLTDMFGKLHGMKNSEN